MSYEFLAGATAMVITTARPRINAVRSNDVPLQASRRIPPLASSTQAYYWTRAWQSGERETLAALGAGEGIEFDSADALVQWLQDDDED